MTTDLNTGRSIQEFWIDFLLEEEFSCDPTFATEFANACGFEIDDGQPIIVAHSVCDEFGEADLIIRFILRGSGDSAALLLENKITASFQPEQALRYRLRGDRGVSDGLWQRYRTVLVAPDRYIQTNHGFDEALSFEKLGGWVCQADPIRRSFKLARLEKAIEKKNSAGVQIVNQTMTDFRDWYRELILEFDRGFIPPASRLAYWDDNWMEWTSDQLPRDWRFRHRTRTGALDISHPEFTVEHFRLVETKLPEGSEFCRVGKHRAGIALALTPITDFVDLIAAKPIAMQALNAAASWQEILKNEPSASVS